MSVSKKPVNIDTVFEWLAAAGVDADALCTAANYAEIKTDDTLFAMLRLVGKVFLVGGEGDDYKDKNGKYLDVKPPPKAKYPNVFAKNYFRSPEGALHLASVYVKNDVFPFTLYEMEDTEKEPYGTFDRPWNHHLPLDRLRKIISMRWEQVSRETENPDALKWFEDYKGVRPTHRSKYSNTCKDLDKRGKPRDTPIASYKLKFTGKAEYRTKLLNAARLLGNSTFEPFKVDGQDIDKYNVHNIIKRGVTAKVAVYDFSTSSFSSYGLSFPVELRYAVIDMSTEQTNELTLESIGVSLSELVVTPVGGAAAKPAGDGGGNSDEDGDAGDYDIDDVIAQVASA